MAFSTLKPPGYPAGDPVYTKSPVRVTPALETVFRNHETMTQPPPILEHGELLEIHHKQMKAGNLDVAQALDLDYINAADLWACFQHTHEIYEKTNDPAVASNWKQASRKLAGKSPNPEEDGRWISSTRSSLGRILRSPLGDALNNLRQIRAMAMADPLWAYANLQLIEDASANASLSAQALALEPIALARMLHRGLPKPQISLPQDTQDTQEQEQEKPRIPKDLRHHIEMARTSENNRGPNRAHELGFEHRALAEGGLDIQIPLWSYRRKEPSHGDPDTVHHVISRGYLAWCSGDGPHTKYLLRSGKPLHQLVRDRPEGYRTRAHGTQTLTALIVSSRHLTWNPKRPEFTQNYEQDLLPGEARTRNIAEGTEPIGHLGLKAIHLLVPKTNIPYDGYAAGKPNFARAPQELGGPKTQEIKKNLDPKQKAFTLEMKEVVERNTLMLQKGFSMTLPLRTQMEMLYFPPWFHAFFGNLSPQRIQNNNLKENSFAAQQSNSFVVLQKVQPQKRNQPKRYLLVGTTGGRTKFTQRDHKIPSYLIKHTTLGVMREKAPQVLDETLGLWNQMIESLHQEQDQEDITGILRKSLGSKIRLKDVVHIHCRPRRIEWALNNPLGVASLFGNLESSPNLTKTREKNKERENDLDLKILKNLRDVDRNTGIARIDQKLKPVNRKFLQHSFLERRAIQFITSHKDDLKEILREYNMQKYLQFLQENPQELLHRITAIRHIIRMIISAHEEENNPLPEEKTPPKIRYDDQDNAQAYKKPIHEIVMDCPRLDRAPYVGAENLILGILQGDPLDPQTNIQGPSLRILAQKRGWNQELGRFEPPRDPRDPEKNHDHTHGIQDTFRAFIQHAVEPWVEPIDVALALASHDTPEELSPLKISQIRGNLAKMALRVWLHHSMHKTKFCQKFLQKWTPEMNIKSSYNLGTNMFALPEGHPLRETCDQVIQDWNLQDPSLTWSRLREFNQGYHFPPRLRKLEALTKTLQTGGSFPLPFPFTGLAQLEKSLPPNVVFIPDGESYQRVKRSYQNCMYSYMNDAFLGFAPFFLVLDPKDPKQLQAIQNYREKIPQEQENPENPKGILPQEIIRGSHTVFNFHQSHTSTTDYGYDNGSVSRKQILHEKGLYRMSQSESRRRDQSPNGAIQKTLKEINHRAQIYVTTKNKTKTGEIIPIPHKPSREQRRNNHDAVFREESRRPLSQEESTQIIQEVYQPIAPKVLLAATGPNGAVARILAQERTRLPKVIQILNKALSMGYTLRKDADSIQELKP